MIKVKSYHVVTIDGDDVQRLSDVLEVARVKLHDASYDPYCEVDKLTLRYWIGDLQNKI